MSTPERLAAWLESVERNIIAGKALQAAIKLFDTGGPDAQAAWASVEAARAAYIASNRREQAKWAKVTEPADQTEMSGMERPGPAAGKKEPPRLLPGRRQLPAGDGA